jgi:hypothetical protein
MASSPEEKHEKMSNFKAWVTLHEYKDLSAAKRYAGLKSIHKKYIDGPGEFSLKLSNASLVAKVSGSVLAYGNIHL